VDIFSSSCISRGGSPQGFGTACSTADICPVGNNEPAGDTSDTFVIVQDPTNAPVEAENIPIENAQFTAGEQAGIVAGIIVGFLALIVISMLIMFLISHRRKQSRRKPATAKTADARFERIEFGNYLLEVHSSEDDEGKIQ
jgi:hypothetical protein